MWALRAYVLARKGVLITNPDVKAMTKTQWVFEYHALRRKEEQTFKSYADAFRQTLVSVLGLNMIRPVNENGLPKTYDEMSDDEKVAFMPLVAWCGHPEMLKKVFEQMQSEIDMSSVTDPDSDYEKLVASIDAADGDMIPILDLDADKDGLIKDPVVHQQAAGLMNILEVDGR
jgi:hypothetical protein